MRRPKKGWTVALLLVFASACQGADSGPEPGSSEASAQLQQLADEIWQRQIERSPFLRIREGLPVEKLPELQFARAQEDADYWRSVLDRLAEIDTSQLTHDEVLTWEILEWQSAMAVEGLQHFWRGSILTPYSNPLPNLRQIFAAQPLEDTTDLENYLQLLEEVTGFVRSMHEIAYGQAERGYVVSRANMPAVIAVTRAQIQPPDAHPFAVASEKLERFATEDIEAFESAFANIIDTQINPALEELAVYLEGDYLAQAPEGVGISQYAGGEEAYRYLVRLHTTMDVTPEEVHGIGLEMVREIQEQMGAIQAEVGFEGTRGEFHDFLKSDESFYPENPDEVAERLQSAADAFFARADDYFLVRPEAPFGVKRLDPALEGSQTYGYYSPPTPTEPTGYYNYNGSNLNERSWLNLEGVSYHELFPGHHFHIARQFENDALPDIRRNSMQTAFTEGWGSYSSFLGLEAGMYEDPYSRYGMYMLEIFLATRLVVDPGMNYLGWSLAQGRDFMRESTLESETQIATESLRYSTDMPGQALGYQMGKRKFLELRAKAEHELGGSFDIRRFHEAIIGPGSMPMTVLEKHIDWFIEQERGRD